MRVDVGTTVVLIYTIVLLIDQLLLSFNHSLSCLTEKRGRTTPTYPHKHTRMDALATVYVLCRRGIASQRGAAVLIPKLKNCDVKNVDGGLTDWASLPEVKDFHMY